MAQQITGNNSLLDALTTSTSMSYTDTTKNQFDSIYNKSINKQKDIDNNATTIQNKSSEQPVAETKIEQRTSDSSTNSTNKTEINETETINTNKVEEKNIEENNYTDQEENEKQEISLSLMEIAALSSEAIDLTPHIQYENNTTEDTDIDNDIDIDIDIDVNINFDIPDIIKAFDEDNIDNKNTIEEAVTNFDINYLKENLISETNITENENQTTVNISNDIDIENIDIESSNNNNNNLISQKIIDELDVTIEDLSLNEIGEETSLMDSIDQVIKYSLEKDSETNTTIVNEDIDLTQEEPVVNTNITDKISIKSDTNTNTENKTYKTEEQDNFEPVLKTNNDATNQDSSSEDSSLNNQNNNTEDSKDTKKKATITSDNKNIFDTKTSETNDDSDIKIPTINSVTSKSAVTQTTSNTGVLTHTTQTLQQTNISKADVISQIYNKLQTMNSSNNKLTMILNPESLGKVTIQLANTKDGMVAEMVVQSQAVKEILDESITNLKESLSAQGINVNDVTVKVSESDNNTEMDYTEQENSDSNRQDQEKQKHQEKEKNKFEQMFLNSQEEQKENN